MGRDKASLIARDQYAALKAAELAAEMIAAAEADQAGTDLIVLEATGESTWDDIVLTRNTDTLGAPQANWQIKRQNTELSQKVMTAVFEGIVERQAQAVASSTIAPEFWLGLASLTSVNRPSGPELRLDVLQHLTRTLRNNAVDVTKVVASATAPERAWFQFIATVTGDPDASLNLATVRELHVVALGDEDALRHSGKSHLAHHYREPADVFESLFDYLNKNTNPSLRARAETT